MFGSKHSNKKPLGGMKQGNTDLSQLDHRAERINITLPDERQRLLMKGKRRQEDGILLS
ncbi:hypothetical protein [Nitrosospira multiformis]|uniref:hypothetical protein n=1 Tax=Nitrosospira multiformis TaxID=1231 RepID=UPI0003026B86|nr:hypothetical protein [Nitrosospira multiformis]SDZ89542.1 hypothetical protein SAMN05216411_102320 [Nitrosospira multiformis]